MTTMLVIFYAIFGAVVWRLRGGLFGVIVYEATGLRAHTALTRLVCSVMFAAPLWACGPWVMSYTALALFIAMCIGYFHSSMEARTAAQVGWMSLWGLGVCLMATAALPGWWPWSSLGLLAGPIYWALDRWQERLPERDWSPLVGPRAWSEWAELLFGVVLGVAMALSI